MKATDFIKNNANVFFLVILLSGIMASAILIEMNIGLFFAFSFNYAVISFVYLFYRYSFGILDYPLHQNKHKDVCYEPSVSIIIPCFNEEKNYLVQCIESACNADYPKKEVIVIDDGSTKEDTWKSIVELNKRLPKFFAHRFKKNLGKRSAMAYGIRHCNSEIIITVDSDSVITSGDSIRALVKPLSNERVGTVSGCILVKNIKDSFMTRLQDARYWIAFFIEKASQNPYNSVTCASGPFSAYRRKYLMEYIDKWENQTFLGEKCTYGDDRGLTTFMLQSGYDVKFARDALLYTNVPETLRKFVKQQIRWKKSFIRENWYLLHFVGKKNIFMKMEFFLFWVVFLCGFVAKFVAFSMLFFGYISLVKYAIMLLFVTFIHYLYAFIRSPGLRGLYGMMYGFLNEFIFSWLFFYSMLTMKDSKWGTR